MNDTSKKTDDLEYTSEGEMNQIEIADDWVKWRSSVVDIAYSVNNVRGFLTMDI
jgi:hypothetical protein